MTEFRFLLKSLRSGLPLAAKGAAPVDFTPPTPKHASGAAIFTSEGDLADLPHFARVAVKRFNKSPRCNSARTCVVEREGMPLGALPLPLGPP